MKAVAWTLVAYGQCVAPAITKVKNRSVQSVL